MTSSTSMTLLEITTRDEMVADSDELRNDVAHVWEPFQEEGTRVFSMQQDGKRLLTVAVHPDGCACNVAGQNMRAPTPAELAILESLLIANGFTLSKTETEWTFKRRYNATA